MAAVVNSALVIMAKAPEPGEVKTRLCPPLTPKSAAEFYRCMLQDKIAQACTVPEADVFVALPESVSEERCREVACGCRHILQYGPDLGARLLSCAEKVFGMGYARVLLVDSDSPTLPTVCFQKAFEALACDRDLAVLGPAADGGYYLIGMSRLYPELFQAIPWSTPDVLKCTLEQASSAGLELEMLPEWYDIDVVKDLERLLMELAFPEISSAAPATTAWLANWKP